MPAGYVYNTTCWRSAKQHIDSATLPAPYQHLAVYCEMRGQDLLFCHAWDRATETLILGIPNFWRLESCSAADLDQRLIEELITHRIRSTKLIGYGPALDLLSTRS